LLDRQQVLGSDTGQFNGSMLGALALAAVVATGPSACGSKWAKWAAIISTLCTSALLIASLVLGLVRDWDAALDGIRLLDPTELTAFGRVEVNEAHNVEIPEYLTSQLVLFVKNDQFMNNFLMKLSTADYSVAKFNWKLFQFLSVEIFILKKEMVVHLLMTEILL